jgi:ribulose-phosphate 3-epimerase
MPALQINPSILAADVGHLYDACKRCEDAGADQIHIDLMDGVFVPNMSFSPGVVAMARKAVYTPLNVHLMMMRPDQYVDAFCDAGADTLLVHIEPDYDHGDTLRRIRARAVRAGIVLNPDTELAAIESVLPLVDEVLFMTVFPGFGGQSFIPGPLARMRTLREAHPDLDIGVDGGLNPETCQNCFDHGANVFDIGSSLFKLDDMAAEIKRLRQMTVEVRSGAVPAAESESQD